MCTSLTYTGSDGSVYLGRTLELDVEEPWAVHYFPAGTVFESAPVDDQAPITYTAKHRQLAIAPGSGGAIEPGRAMVTEGLNDAGLTCSLLVGPLPVGGSESVKATRVALQATNLGSWVLSQFASVAEIKEGLDAQPIFLTRMPGVGNVEFPLHAALHDRAGGAIVIEWYRGEQTVYDNPVSVMTNGPQFSWHLTNLSNWTHLTNVNTSTATFGSMDVSQPDAGIATAALPGSQTSVGRFIRALYYSKFTEKVADPDAALITLSRVMNQFDRPRGVTVDPPDAHGEGLTFAGTGTPGTEYTSWTNLSDLNRGRFLARTYAACNYTAFDLDRLADVDGIRWLATADFDPMGGDGTDALRAAVPNPRN